MPLQCICDVAFYAVNTVNTSHVNLFALQVSLRQQHNTVHCTALAMMQKPFKQQRMQGCCQVGTMQHCLLRSIACATRHQLGMIREGCEGLFVPCHCVLHMFCCHTMHLLVLSTPSRSPMLESIMSCVGLVCCFVCVVQVTWTCLSRVSLVSHSLWLPALMAMSRQTARHKLARQRRAQAWRTAATTSLAHHTSSCGSYKRRERCQ